MDAANRGDTTAAQSIDLQRAQDPTRLQDPTRAQDLPRAQDPTRAQVVLSAPVAEVTLLEDRAHVVRRGRARVAAGAARLRLEGVAPVLVDKTLTVTVTAAASGPAVDAPGDAPAPPHGGAQVEDVRVERRQIVRDADRSAEAAELEARVRAAREEVTRLAQARAILDGQIERLGTAAARAVGDLQQDAAWARFDPVQAAADLARIAEAEADRRRARAELEEQAREAGDRLTDLEHRWQAAQSPEQATRADLVIDLRVEAAGDLEVEIGYLVPGACWRPHHTARLIEATAADAAGPASTADAAGPASAAGASAVGAGPRLVFRTDAAIWQRTGESWTEAVVHLSTERPSLGVSPPRLDSDVLAARPVGRTVAVESRDQAIQTTGLGGGAVVVHEVPGVDDGGEVRRLTARRPATIPSDGRPHRVPLFELEAPASVSRVLMGELAEAVVIESTHENTAPHPILAGPVDLVRESGHVGRTTVLFVAPGERFELGWGPDLALRVHREVEQLDDEHRILSSWTTVRYRVRLRLSNLGGDPRTVKVTERIPVSEVEKVEVGLEREKTRPATEADPEGFVRWKVDLAPMGHEELALGWWLKRHEDVVGV